MDWKQKLKTAAIVCFGAVLTACKKTVASGPIERPQGVEAKGNVQDALFESTGNNDNVSEAQLQNIINSQHGQNFSNILRGDLADSHIYMSKKGANGETLVLTSVDKLSYEENGHVIHSYENPQYGPNEITSNVEIKNGMEIRHPESMTFEADTLTAGINHESEAEYVEHEVERVRQLLVDQAKLNGLAPGDTASIDGIKAVVEKNNGKLGLRAPQKEKVMARKRTLTLDYIRGKKAQKTSGS